MFMNYYPKLGKTQHILFKKNNRSKTTGNEWMHKSNNFMVLLVPKSLTFLVKYLIWVINKLTFDLLYVGKKTTTLTYLKNAN